MPTSPSRVAAGVPTGGQFAATARSESTLELVATTHQPGRPPTSVDEPHRPSPASGRQVLKRFGPDGRLRSEEHRFDGSAADLPDGTTTHREHRSDGSVAFERGARDPVGIELAPGETVSHRDPRDGSLVVTSGNGGGLQIERGRPDTDDPHRSSIHILQDGPGGEPAVTFVRADGTVSSITRHDSGGWTYTVDYYPDGTAACVFTNHQNPATARNTHLAWQDIGLDEADWSGLTPSQALTYSGDSVPPAEAIEWTAVDPDPGRTLRWRRAGHTPASALAAHRPDNHGSRT